MRHGLCVIASMLLRIKGVANEAASFFLLCCKVVAKCFLQQYLRCNFVSFEDGPRALKQSNLFNYGF